MPEVATPIYSISEVSERLEFTNRTLHYYEEKLSLPIGRNSSGDRFYTEKDVKLFEAIKGLKSKGMTLAGIKKFLIENGMLVISNANVLTPIEQFDYQKAILKNELKAVIVEQFQAMANEIRLLREENEEFREEVSGLIRQTTDHYDKIDRFITDWREKKKRKSWFKKLFG